MQKRKKQHVFLIFVSLLLSVCLLFCWTDYVIRTVVLNAAKNSAKIKASEIINQAVSDLLEREQLSYSDFITPIYGEDNELKTLESNIITLNQFKAKINTEIIKQIRGFTDGSFQIRIGSLIGHQMLSGIGPKIRFRYDMSGSVESNLEDRFTDAGINQVKHQIMLGVTCSLMVIMPLRSSTVKVETEILLSETVIVGSVPDTYVGLG